MNPIESLFRTFENWIKPLEPVARLRPPETIGAYFWHYLRQAKVPFALTMVFGGLTAMLEALFFYFIGRLVDILDSSLIDQGWQGLIQSHGQELLIMFLVVFVFRIVMVIAEGLLNEQVIDRGFFNLIRWQSYLYVARQSLAFFTNQSSGSVVTKVSQAGSAVGNVLTASIQMVWTIMVFAATTLFLFAQLDWRLALIVAVGIAMFAGVARYFLPRLRAQAAKNAEASAALNGRIVDSYTNIQTLKLFGQADANDDYVRNGFERVLDASLSMGRLSITLRACMTVLTASMVVGVAILSIDLWSQNAISVGSVAFAMALVMRLNMWLGRLMGGLNHLMRNFGTVQNAMETISLPISVKDKPTAKPFVPQKGEVKFTDVSFRYASNRDKRPEVIENLSLHIAAGEKIGLVGRSGAGKTTLVNLLLRFYDLQAGNIQVDGQDVAEVQQDTLRQSIGVVTQDTALLHRSIRENIGFGRENATDAEIVEAAKRAEANEFISDLADQSGRSGYDAYVGERGVKLSGGQRQRIAIARVLLKNAPILILDEATSALDSEVEAAIQSQFDELIEGKTVIAIAHRLSTIAAMDRLIILDKGQIVEQGKHADLLAQNGIYASLWSRQSGGFLSSES